MSKQIGYSQSNFPPNWSRPLPLVGRGTVTFNIVRNTPFSIVIRPAKITRNDDWIALNVRKDSAEFQLGREMNSSSNGVLQPRATGSTPWNEKEKVGFVDDRKVAYWCSFDRDRLVVKYGKGYIMTETTLLTHDFLDGKVTEEEQEAEREKMSYLFAPEVEKVVELYDILPLGPLAEAYALNSLSSAKFNLPAAIHFDNTKASPAQLLSPHFTPGDQATLATPEGKQALSVAKSLTDVEKEVDLYPLPLTVDLPPFVLDSSKLTLFDLDKNTRMFSASLPSACQALYGNVTGGLIDLDWPWPHGGVSERFSDAIRYSINTPGKTLYQKLKEKENEFGEGEKYKTYLRVTLGEFRGDSPGIPYVLEIWPSNHGSPIHNHGNAFAVIKVLYGGLTINVYNKHLDETDKCLSHFDVKKGDVTWISPNWYQTHMLWNHTDDFCATVQCYQYGKDDELSWPYFDYLAHTTVIKEFIPNSDFTFTELHQKLMLEYAVNHCNST